MTSRERRATLAEQRFEEKFQQAEVRIRVGVGQHEEEIQCYQKLRQAEQATYQQLGLARACEHRSIGLYKGACSEIAALKQNVNHPQIVHDNLELTAVQNAMSNERTHILEELGAQFISNLALKTPV